MSPLSRLVTWASRRATLSKLRMRSGPGNSPLLSAISPGCHPRPRDLQFAFVLNHRNCISPAPASDYVLQTTPRVRLSLRKGA